MPTFLHRPSLAVVPCCLLALTIALVQPAHAQFTQSGGGFFMISDYTLKTDVSGYEVFVGKDPGTFATLPGTATLTVTDGAKITQYRNGYYPDGKHYFGLNVFGNYNANIIGGNVNYATSRDTSTVNINGGNTNFAYSYNTSTLNINGGGYFYGVYSYNTSTLNINRGDVDGISGSDTSTVNISGGHVYNAQGSGTTTLNISGGIITNGIIVYGNTATVNFIGTSLAYAYMGYGNSNPYGNYADWFAISGIFNGVPNSYNLYLGNTAGSDGTPNSTPRQFNFLAPVIIPEAGSLAFVLPTLGVLAIVGTRRRRNA